MNTDFFKSNIEKLNIELRAKQRTSSLLSNARLLVFAAGFIFGFAAFNKMHEAAYIILLCVFAAVFVLLIINHSILLKQTERIKSKIFVNEKYIARHEGDWKNLNDKGDDYIDPSHKYSSDLDVFGEKSLFQFICSAWTYLGRIKLKELLIEPNKNISEIKKRQSAVAELSENVSFCIDFESESAVNRSQQSPEELFEYTSDEKQYFSKPFQFFCYGLLFATLVMMVFAIFRNGIFFSIFIGLVGAQAVLRLAFHLKLMNILSKVDSVKKSIESYENLIVMIENNEFKSEALKNLKAGMKLEKSTASKVIKNLASIVNAIDLRYNFLIYFALNLFLLWDFHIVFALEDWKRQYGKHVEDFINTIAEFEALISLSVVGQIDTDTVFAEFTDESAVFSAEEMQHPLIAISKVVPNSFSISQKISVVTGSNMSGKTTLLRTVGINLVLAYAGAPVMAKKFKCSIMEVFTSMRITDNISEGVSTFYAELLRIKSIIEFKKNIGDKQLIFLIDEIFRGTNSVDRISGARSVISNLKGKNTVGFISTHDLELCDSDDSDLVYCYFTERYENGEIVFDYKLHSGISKTTNAVHLMKMVGIEMV